MCGIAGELRPPGEGSGHIEDQLSSLRHRGPDAEGLFEQPSAWLGETRLAVIDLVTGDPPIANEDESVGVAFNGEIYNFRELREELRSGGHTFRSQGDAEVVAHLAEDLDPVAMVSRLDGMFAFAVWDQNNERLILARDRIGKKPLYYWTNGERLVFASEIKSLLANPRVPCGLRVEAIPAYLTFGYVPTPETFFEGIRSLPPGHVLVAEKGGEPRVVRYWHPPVGGVGDGEHLPLTIEDAAAHVRALLEQAVRRRLVADVPLGAFLSGGIDSSSVVAIMARETGRPVQTFTIGFDEAGVFDEREFARLIAARYGTEHHEFVVHPDAVDLIERLVWHHDQPFGDSSAVPTFLLSEDTRRHVTVALSGDGGDELFAGYERFTAALAARRFAALPRPLQIGMRRGVELLPSTSLRGQAGNLQRFARVADRGLPEAYRSWVSYVGDGEREALLAGNLGGGRELSQYGEIWDASAPAHPLDRLLDLNLRTYLLDDLLVKTDRMSMAHGLEVRSPFLDDALFEFAVRLDPRLKVRRRLLKRVLRAAVSDLLPEAITARPKHGFGVPVDRWFRDELRVYVRSTLGAPDARIKQYLAGEAVDRMLAEHDSRARDHGQALWTLLTLEVFLRGRGW